MGTTDIVNEWKPDMLTQGLEMGIKMDTMQDIIDTVEKERLKVNTQVHSLYNHGKAAILMGMWSNDTIIEVKNTLICENWDPSKAMQMTLKLMTTTQWIGLMVAQRMQYNYETFIADITEQDILDMGADIEHTKSAKALGLKYGKWNMTHSLQMLTEDPEGKAYIMDQASINNITTQEVKMDIDKAIGPKKQK